MQLLETKKCIHLMSRYNSIYLDINLHLPVGCRPISYNSSFHNLNHIIKIAILIIHTLFKGITSIVTIVYLYLKYKNLNAKTRYSV